MERKIMVKRGVEILASAAVALGMWISPTVSAVAAEYNQQRPCRPYYCPPCQPSAPHAAPHSDLPPSETQPMDSPSDMPMTPDQTTPDQTAPQTPNFQAASAAASTASLSPGGNTPMLGRMDATNRLNIFDNMAAAPMDRVWFGYQLANNFNQDLQANGILNAQGVAVAKHENQVNYRIGVEYAFNCDFSVAFQAQYFDPSNDQLDGNWSQPQIMLKYVLARDCDSIVSATLGITPQTSTDPLVIEEDTTKVYPGILVYEDLSDTVFVQGGFQFGIPLNNNHNTIHTFDWSAALGYWMYRDCCAQSCCGSSALITGVAPQINILGKHVLGDQTIQNPFGFTKSGGGLGVFSNGFTYVEDATVIDLTGGTTILALDDTVQVGLGYSIPLTGGEVREGEFIGTVQYNY